jgi:hypothetical protein
MTIPTEHQCHDSNTTDARRRRRCATRVAVAGATGIAVLALFATAWSGADESTVASGQVGLVDQTIQLPPNVAAALPSWLTPLLQQVDDSAGDDSSVGTDDTTANNDDSELQQQLLQQQQDQDEAQLSENNAIQSMLQSQQLAQEQNDQAEQQFTQDELQAQQDEQEADQS